MKIKELEINQMVTIPLVVRAVSVRETKSKKSYLSFDFFDGTDVISGNYWDWNGLAIPDKNAILDVKAQVTEWQGNKQLNIKGLVTNTTLSLSAFAPKSGVAVDKVYADAYALVSDVKDDFLRMLAQGLLEEFMDAWLVAPGAKAIHHAFVAGTLVHSYSVAKIAKSVASTIDDANEDLCVVGGMLHDIGKLSTYIVNGASIDMSSEGMMFDHLHIGTNLIEEYAKDHFEIDPQTYDKLCILKHIILSHHGKLEYGAVVTPMCMEAHIVYHADAVDAAAEQIREMSAKVEHSMWTDKIWALENRPHLTTQYVAETMEFKAD